MMNRYFNNGHYFTAINEWSSSPCQNQGTCIDMVNGYVCYCASGYDGSDCENGKSIPSLAERIPLCP